MRHPSVVIVALVLFPILADAQSAGPAPGTRIRMTVPTGAPAREGVLLEWLADGALVLPKGSRDPILITPDRLGDVEMFSGTRSNVAVGALVGSIVGFASGAGIGLLLSGEDYIGSGVSTGDVLSLGALTAAFGAGAGALWGLVEGKPTWEPIQAGPVRLQAGLGRRRVGLSLAVSF